MRPILSLSFGGVKRDASPEWGILCSPVAPHRPWREVGEDLGSLLRQPFGMDLLARIEEEITALRGSGALAAAFRSWREHREGLRSFGDTETLIAFLRDPQAEPRRRKDAALAALCAEASSGDQRAATLLLWLLLPGLVRVRRSLTGGDALGTQDLNAELAAGAWEAATRVQPQTQNVAARLVNEARRRAIAAIREAATWARCSEPLGAEAELPEPEAEPDGLQDILTEAVWEGVISRDEVQLLLASRQTIREVGPRLAVTHWSAQKRRQRARQRLLAWLAESSPIPTQPLVPRPPRNPSEKTPGSRVQERPSGPPL